MASFNIGKTIAASLSVQLTASANAAATAVSDAVGRKVSGAIQNITNYAIPDAVKKASEAANKLLSQNNVGEFSNLSKTVGLQTINGITTVTDTTSGKVLTQMGSSRGEFLDAELIPPTKEMKVTISQEPNHGVSPVVFDVMPTISEDGGATYDSFTPVHHPGEILKYTGSSARSWQVSAQLICRNTSEATRNLETLNTIRAWRMPFYGQGTEETSAELLGAPPPILTLSAYGSLVIGPVKCVMESYSVSWPNDVDYLPAIDSVTKESKPFPVILSININLKESWAPREFSEFSLKEYQRGDMKAAFSTSRAPKPVGAWGAEARDASGKRYSLTEPANLSQGDVNTTINNLDASEWGREARNAYGTASNIVPQNAKNFWE